MGAGCDLLQVSSADSAGVYAKEDLAPADLRDWNGFEADVVYPAVHCRLHGSGTGPPSIFHDELFCQRHI
jgi:hypothetical protein